MGIVVAGVSALLAFWSAGIDHAILRNVIVVTDGVETTGLVAGFGLLRIYHLQLCMQKVLRTAVRTVMTKLMTDFQFTFMMINFEC